MSVLGPFDCRLEGPFSASQPASMGTGSEQGRQSLETTSCDGMQESLAVWPVSQSVVEEEQYFIPSLLRPCRCSCHLSLNCSRSPSPPPPIHTHTHIQPLSILTSAVIITLLGLLCTLHDRPEMTNSPPATETHVFSNAEIHTLR